jgi:hypothetical protein
VLAGDVMSNHSNPRMYWQPMSWTPKHLSRHQYRVTYIPCLAPVKCTQHWIWKEPLSYLSGLLSFRLDSTATNGERMLMTE